MLIDFGRGTNASPIVSPTFYNNVTAPAGAPTVSQPLIDSATGVATTWTVSASGSNNYGEAGGGADVTIVPASVSSTFAQSAYGDSLFANTAGIITVTFSNLSLTDTYNLLLYGSRNNGQSGPQTFTLTAGTGNAAPVTHPSGDNRTVVVDWTDLVPDATGNLTFTLSTPSGASSALNAGRLSSVPEPSSILMLGVVSFLGLLQRRRSSFSMK